MKNHFLKLIRGYFYLKISCFLFLFFILFFQSCTDQQDIEPQVIDRSHLERYNSLLRSQQEIILQFQNTHSRLLSNSDFKALSADRYLENESRELLVPLLKGSKAFLHDLGFNDDDIEYIVDGKDEYSLIPLAMLIYEVEVKKLQASQEDKFVGFSGFFSTTAKAQDVDWNKVGRCAAIALGIDFFLSASPEVMGKNNKWTKKALKKFFGKVAARMFGPVGVVITTASFLGCMYDVTFW